MYVHATVLVRIYGKLHQSDIFLKRSLASADRSKGVDPAACSLQGMAADQLAS